MRSKKLSCGVLLAVAVAGCGGSTPVGPMPGRVSEGAAALVGTWELRDPLSGRLELRVVIGSDKTVTATEYSSTGTPGDTTSGTYAVAGNALISETARSNGTRGRGTTLFYVDDRYLAVDVYYPSGAHTGAIGTWSRWQENTLFAADGAVVEKAQSTETVELRADGTASLTRVATQLSSPGSRPVESSHSGTYVQSPVGTYNLSLNTTASGVMSKKLISIGDEVLAKSIFTRAAN